jgi:amino-acid N-acetyltransferase
LEGLSANDLRGAYSNALVAHPKGIIQGLDHRLTGRVERVDTGLLQGLLDRDVIPIIPPLGCDGEGNTYRLNSDAVAVEVARSLGAVKLIYLSTFAGIASERSLLRQLTTEEAECFLRENRVRMNAAAISKLEHSIRATRHGVPRVHIIDGRVEEGLLAEVFSNEGIGTLVHANEYQAIRPALKKDVRALYALMQTAMDNDELIRRSLSEIQRHLADFFVFEVDRNPVGCVAVHFYGEEQKAEIACLCVSPSHENQGIAAKLIQYAESHARARGAVQVFCLSTQAVNYFVKKSGFQLGSPDDLPAPRRERYERNARRSQVLVKPLGSKQAV